MKTLKDLKQRCEKDYFVKGRLLFKYMHEMNILNYSPIVKTLSMFVI